MDITHLYNRLGLAFFNIITSWSFKILFFCFPYLSKFLNILHLIFVIVLLKISCTVPVVKKLPICLLFLTLSSCSILLVNYDDIPGSQLWFNCVTHSWYILLKSVIWYIYIYILKIIIVNFHYVSSASDELEDKSWPGSFIGIFHIYTIASFFSRPFGGS